MAARHEEQFKKENVFKYFLVHKGLLNYDIGVARGTVFHEIWPEAGFKTGDFVQENLGGLP